MAERAFIAEDDVRQVRAVRRALLPTFDFVEAHDARAARRILRTGLNYALVILDVHLPGTKDAGLALLEEFHPRAPKTVFVLMSGDLSPRVINFAAPRAHFVAKPFDVAGLRAIAATARAIVPACDDRIAKSASLVTSSWQLSPMERRIIACHLDGRTKVETCALLGFTGRTHESHARHILAKAARQAASFRRLLDLILHLERRARELI